MASAAGDAKGDTPLPQVVDPAAKPKPKLEPSASTFLKHSAKKGKKWYRLNWDRLVRILQLFTTLDIVIPIVMMYDAASDSICPYPILCARGPIEITLLFIAKVSATLMYVPLAVIIVSKCATLRAFIQSTYLAEMIDLYGLHEMHVNFGIEVSMYALLHVLCHVARLMLHDERLFWKGGRTINSGYPLALSFLLLVPPFACEWIKKRVSFEARKALHMMAIPALIALVFHHYRLHWFAGILLALYGLDWLYSNTFKTYRVSKPFLFPEPSGTVIEFKPPPGFSCTSGQYVFVCAPYISKYEWHPFSIIPAATADGKLAVSLYALACGNWTNKLHLAAKRNVRRPIWVNGGYPSPFDTSIKFDYLFLVCTGIGITPGISVISQYCYSKVIVLIWVCREQDIINLYGNELQVVNTKVYYTGKGASKTNRVDGSVMYCTGRPDVCGEINNVIIHKRPLWAQGDSSPRASDGGTFDTENPEIKRSHTPAELGMTGPIKRPNAAVKKPPALEAAERPHEARPSDQPFRRAMMDLHQVERQEDVDHTEWLVLYCGASAKLGAQLEKHCRDRGINYKTEFFGSW